jgi:anti-sigma B factor antagonist
MTDAIATREENRALIRPAGDVVAGSIAGLRDLMRNMLAEGVREIVLDLANVRMLDSRGIGLLIAGHNSLHKAGGNLSVIHASKDVLELLRTMRIHQHFSISGE